MKYSVYAIVCFCAVLFSGCGSGNSLTSAYNVTKCEYTYKSVTDLTFSGMNLSNGISPLQVPKILALLNGSKSSLPLDLTLNLNVKNPNSSSASFAGLDYILSIDNIKFTTGKINHQMNIPAGQTQGLPINIGIDLATLLKGESKSAVENITKNILGIGGKESNVTIQIKPTFMMGGIPVTSPFYIPVSFTIG